MKIKAILIDDEKMARTLLSGLLERYCPEIELVEQCSDLPSGVKAIIKHKPNLVFLDIEMPGHSGLELLDFFDEQTTNFSIIFTTAYNQYAIKAFKLSAVDYLLKPIDPKELQQSIELYKKQQNQIDYSILKSNLAKPVSNQKLAVHSIQSTKYIELKNLLFCKADGAYTEIYLKEGHHITSSKGLKHYEDLLKDNPQFIRCQKSYIINLHFVTEHIKSDGGFVMVNNIHKIPIAADKLSEITKKLIDLSSILA